MTTINQFTAHIGLDWADKKHDVESVRDAYKYTS